MVVSRTVLALLPLVLLVVALDVYALLHLVRAPAVRHLPKAVWAVIVLVSAPFGALADLALGRSPHGPDLDTPRSGTGPQPAGTPGR